MDNAANRIGALVVAVAGAGLGNFTLGAAISADMKPFGAAHDSKSYTVVITEGNAWEVRTGCVFTDSTKVLTRGTFEDSSTGSAISFSTAAKVRVSFSAGQYLALSRPTYTWAGKPTADGSNVGSVISVSDVPAGFRSEWVNSDGTQWLPLNVVLTHTDATTAAGLGIPALGYRVQSFAPGSSPAGAIRFARIDRFEYNTTQANSGAGHTGAGLDWFVQKNTGNSFFALAHESKFDNESAGATITTAVAEESQMSRNDGTVTTFYGQRSRITANAGTVGKFVGHRFEIAANAGTITQAIGYEFPDLSAISGIGSKRLFVNSDANAPAISASVFVSSSTDLNSPSATGQTVPASAIPKRRILITPVADYAAQTWTFPAKASVVDGWEYTFTTTKGVTTLSFNANGATGGVFGAPTTIPNAPAVTVVHFVYNAGVDAWIRN